MSKDLAELIGKLKAAIGPSRSTDLYVHARIVQAGQWSERDIRYALMDIEGTTAPPAYTASVDAALALVERIVGDRWFSILLDAMRDFGAAGTLGPEHLPRFVTLHLLLDLQSQGAS